MNAPQRLFLTSACNEPIDNVGLAPQALARFVVAAARVKSADDFVRLARGALKRLFPHGMLLAGIGHAQGERIVAYRAIGVNYPGAYLNRLKQQRVLAGPVLARWLHTRACQLFDIAAPPFPVPERWLAAARRHELQNIAAHGVRDVNGTGASYFTFSQIPGPLGERQRQTLEALTPILHQALLNASAAERQFSSQRGRPPAVHLTEREREVLKWLVQGKSPAEIALHLDRSAHTVKNQMRSILLKLGASNRAQAISTAFRLNLLPEADQFKRIF